SPGNENRGTQISQLLKGLTPFLEVGVTAIRGGPIVDRIATEHDAVLRDPHHGIALGVAAPHVQDFNLKVINVDGETLIEDDVGPGQTGDGFSIAEQAGEAAVFALVVCLAALLDKFAGTAAGNHHRLPESR